MKNMKQNIHTHWFSHLPGQIILCLVTYGHLLFFWPGLTTPCPTLCTSSLLIESIHLTYELKHDESAKN